MMWLVLLAGLLATRRYMTAGVEYRWTHEWRGLSDRELRFLVSKGYDPSLHARVAARSGDSAVINYDQKAQFTTWYTVPGPWQSGKWFLGNASTRAEYRLVDVRLPEA